MIEARVKRKLGDFMLDAELRDEGFVCIWGPNGAGKTTLLNVIAGLLSPDEGSIKVGSEDVTSYPLEKRGIVLVKQDSCIPHLTVEDHLGWGAKARGTRIDSAQIEKVRKDLGVTYSGRVGSLSTGMRERVSLATALMSGPKAILIDEVFSSISERGEFIVAYRRLARQARVDVLFTSQAGDILPESLDHSYSIRAGRTTREF